MAVLVKGLMVCGRHRAQKKRTGLLREQPNYKYGINPRWPPPSKGLAERVVSATEVPKKGSL